MPHIVHLSLNEHFSAAHRLNNSHLSAEENVKFYGKCNHHNGHGHNYDLVVTVSGPIDSKTGMVINAQMLKDWVNTRVLDILDHRNIDKDVAYFNDRPSTCENLAVFIWIRLSQVMPAGLLHKIDLWETSKISVSFAGEGLTDEDIEKCTV
ncbi:hypothetical protein IW140_002543 [Coemansia sp. RSA 1813]|nr:hypothetical protein EV178_001886 [Coemansia sp. RSA 1646]KAJ1769647.1 hypothetical protein LPJ74_003896 [Coemansia sp. RSA 1843]KAJ2090980.1 hypothetical protein IW138_002174 [Coemansia sp. RSA 986]KAJ2215891.1 hypothetical protein EV179_001719 [Coemansia sp. RSA 487]KAJ2570267.1 hypothetical protein IW140_002543 [Coemansia sp. RSA 1813]